MPESTSAHQANAVAKWLVLTSIRRPGILGDRFETRRSKVSYSDPDVWKTN